MILLGLALAGAAGALARYGVDAGLRRWWPAPLPILLVNVTGSALLGFLTGLLAAGSPALVVLGTGFCGSYTTFSTACWETVGLLRAGRRRAAVLHLLGTIVATGLAASVGLLVGLV
jgi:CrcB protein